MTDASKWNARYKKAEYFYGTEANEYLKQQLKDREPGKIIFPADGEGRNSVYAATLGWEVTAFDISIEGRRKALQLADNKKVDVDYRVGNLHDLNFKINEFDAAALIYAHLPASVRPGFFELLNHYLKPGALVVFEAFSKNHLKYQEKNHKVGGPQHYETLFSIKELQNAFPDYKVLELAETEVELNEGHHHVGTGSVIRFTGIKK